MISQSSGQTGLGLQPAPHLLLRGSGPPVLLLHGWGSEARLFAPVIAGLEDRFRLIAPDFPGCGQTLPPSFGWSVSDYVAWTLHLLDSLDVSRCAIVGHSHGGRVALRLAAENPERVSALVLTASAGILPERDLRYRLRVRRYKSVRWLAGQRWVPHGISARVRARVAQSGSTDYQAASGTMRETLLRVINEDLTPFLARISAPTLLIWGDADDATPLADGERMERAIPDAGLVVFPGAGHFAYAEQPGRFVHIVRTFFEKLPAW